MNESATTLTPQQPESRGRHLCEMNEQEIDAMIVRNAPDTATAARCRQFYDESIRLGMRGRSAESTQRMGTLWTLLNPDAIEDAPSPEKAQPKQRQSPQRRARMLTTEKREQLDALELRFRLAAVQHDADAMSEMLRGDEFTTLLGLKSYDKASEEVQRGARPFCDCPHLHEIRLGL